MTTATKSTNNRQLSDYPTKADEIEFYREFVANLPAGSYLAAILHDSEGYIENEIRNDFARPLAGELHECQVQALAAAAELLETQKKLAAAQTSLRDIESKHNRFAEAITAIRRDAQRLASI